MFKLGVPGDGLALSLAAAAAASLSAASLFFAATLKRARRLKAGSTSLEMGPGLYLAMAVGTLTTLVPPDLERDLRPLEPEAERL